MKKRLPFLASFLFFLLPAFGQPYHQTIRGQVTDRDSRESLPGAAVVILGTDPLRGSSSDHGGNYRIDRVPAGRYTLRVTFLGYHDLVVPEVTVTTGKETVLNVELTQRILEVRGVVVSAAQQDRDKSLNTMAAISARKLNMDDASRYAGGFSDAARMVSSFAGVSAVEGDGVNDLIIRGNTPRGLLWRLEGTEIPNPNHFTDGQGGSGGAISIINSNLLATSDFFTGAFPAEYGNATSGVMDLCLRKGNEDRREYSVQLGVAGMEASAEGPLSKEDRSAYLVNYRYSTFGLLSRAGLVDLGNNNLPPVFQDLAFNFTFPTKRRGTFSVFGVGGQSNTGTEPVKDSLQWTGREGRFFEVEDHRMGVTGIRHFILLPGSKTSVKSALTVSYQQDKWKSGLLDENYDPFTEYDDNYSYPSLRGSVTVNSKLSARNTVRCGITYSRLFYSLFQREYGTAGYDTLTDQQGRTGLLQSFVQWKHRFSDRLEASTGVHLVSLALNGQTSAEPRFGLRWTPGTRSSVNAGAGFHSRMDAIPFYTALIVQEDGSRSQANRHLGFSKAFHLVLGYDYSLSKEWRIKAETYYQHLYEIPVVPGRENNVSALNYMYGVPDVVLVNKGIGRNTGMEFTLEKFYTGDYYCLFTASLYDSRFKGNDGKWYSTVFNGNYVLNLLAGKDFSFGNRKQNVFGMNLKSVVRGGYRISPVDQERSKLLEEVVYDDSRPFGDQLPAFARVDFGTYVRINRSGCSWVISADIQNITDRKNTLGYDYSQKEGRVVPEEGIGMVPVLNFRAEF